VTAASYLGRRRNAYIVGLEVAESERLLDEIWSYVDAAVYVRKWALGDLVVWDNRTTMHRRDAFGPEGAPRDAPYADQRVGAPRRAAQ
jgi:taurine dioxygenase